MQFHQFQQLLREESWEERMRSLTPEQQEFEERLGDCIGTGYSREVYEDDDDNGRVIKVDRKQENNWMSNEPNNVSEWKTWSHFKNCNAWLADFLAPCHEISTCKTYLTMSRTQPVSHVPSNHPLKKAHGYGADLQDMNIGLLDGRLVAHDYAELMVRIGDPMFEAREMPSGF